MVIINAVLTFKLKNDSNSTTGNKSMPSDEMMKSDVFNQCKFFLIPKKVQFTIV